MKLLNTHDFVSLFLQKLSLFIMKLINPVTFFYGVIVVFHFYLPNYDSW